MTITVFISITIYYLQLLKTTRIILITFTYRKDNLEILEVDYVLAGFNVVPK